MSEALHGVVNLLKPPGMTSHDVVSFARRVLSGKVGHTGTLDPLAAGVLVLTVGAATRLTDLLASDDKAYRAEIILGLETDTLDLEGSVVATCDASAIDAEQVRETLGQLAGDLQMLPPMYSAVKQDGRKLYEMARKGREVERKPRSVTVMRFELIRFTPGPQPTCVCEIECSKGTYVRSLAQMLGEHLGVGGCLSFLLRTRQGHHRLADSTTLEELAALSDAGRVRELLTPLALAAPDMARVQVSEEQVALLRNGRLVALDLDPATEGMVMVLLGDQAICLGEVAACDGRTELRPRKVFPPQGNTDSAQ